MRIKKTLSNWLTNRFQMVIRNEENLAEVSSFNFTYAKVFLVLTLLLVLIFIGSLYLSQTVLAQWFDPRHETIEYNKKLLKLTNAVDSLNLKVHKQEAFIKNFQSIIDGEVPEGKPINQKVTQSVEDYNKETDVSMPAVDSTVQEQFDELEDDYQTLPTFQKNLTPSSALDIFLFSPVQGIVSSPYNPKTDHYGVDIVAKSNEPVKCVADGTVILSSWTQDSGYVIAIQHSDNLISVYKHNSALLKKVGNFVSAGEVISIIGNTGELTTGPHLHFELWYNGNPIDPEEFITF